MLLAAQGSGTGSEPGKGGGVALILGIGVGIAIVLALVFWLIIRRSRGRRQDHGAHERGDIGSGR